MKRLEKQIENEGTAEDAEDPTKDIEDAMPEELENKTMDKTHETFMEVTSPEGKKEDKDDEELTDDDDITLESSQAPPPDVLSQVPSKAPSVLSHVSKPVEDALSYVPSEAISQMPS